MMTWNELAMFAAGVFWGIFIIKPLWDVIAAIWTNARKAQNGNNR